MPDETPTPDAPQIVVKPGPSVPVVMNLLRQAGVAIGFFTTVVAMLGRHDLRGVVAFVTGDSMVPVLGAFALIGSAAGSTWKTIHNEWVKRTLARKVDDNTAVVAGDAPSAPAPAAR